jgi:hypothetical protein
MYLKETFLTEEQKRTIVNWFYGLSCDEPIDYVPVDISKLVSLGRKNNPEGRHEYKEYVGYLFRWPSYRFAVSYQFECELICPLCGHAYRSYIELREKEFKVKKRWRRGADQFAPMQEVKSFLETRIDIYVDEYPPEYCDGCCQELKKILSKLPRPKNRRGEYGSFRDRYLHLRPRHENPNIDLAKSVYFHLKIKQHGKNEQTNRLDE